MSKQWFENRFEPNQRRIQRCCVVCNRAMWLPPSKVDKYVTCGGVCAEQRYASTRKPATPKKAPVLPRAWECKGCSKPMVGGKASKVFCCASCRKDHSARVSAALALDRTRVCETCAKQFIVKKSQVDTEGHGRYCCRACAVSGGAFSHLVEQENLIKAQAARIRSIKKNGTKHKRGPEHPSWRGGVAASKERRRDQDRQYRREYRAKNTELVREYGRKRNARKVERLPRGTVKRIGNAQRWKCAVCRTSIAGKYHMDHIMPLARGGEHAPSNIQLLCPSCNVRKSAKHPVDFMRERGFLL